MSERTCEGETGIAARIPWMIFAPFEFAVTIIVGVLLYLFVASYFAACLFVTATSDLFDRACALIVLRFRVGRVVTSTNGRKEAPPLSEIAAHRADGEERFRSWLN